MEDTLYAVFSETGEVRWAACAALFVKPNWFNPLAAGADVLAGRHANTHLAQVLGFAARFEATGHAASAAAVANFFTALTWNHSFSTGGSNWWEGWGQPASLGFAIGDDPKPAANTQESCTSYNVLKIARALFRWTGRPDLADFYERALLNGVLGVQRHGQGHSHDGHGAHTHAHAPAQLLRPSAADRAAIAASNAAHAAHPRPANFHTVAWPDDPARGGGQPAAATAAGDDPDLPGQFIYYMPLGAGVSKGDNPGAWTQGFGSPFNSFWCCYGTAVESFSKLADSIYFFFSPPEPPSTPHSFIARLLAAWPLRLAAPPRPPRPAPRPPSLFVNQLASSTLRWRELGVTVRQTDDLYPGGDNVATARLVIGVEAPPSGAAAAAHRPGARFFLHFRMPSWVNATSPSAEPPGGLELRLNGRPLDVGALPRSGGAPGGTVFVALPALQDFSPPTFGEGADYVVMGPEWTDGDVLEARLPMAVGVEDLNDARPELQALKAVTLGPFVMAGITQGDRALDLAPEEVAGALVPPDAGGGAGLVSLAPRAARGDANSPAALLQHVGAWKMGFGPAGAARRARPAALAATFRTVAVGPGELGNACMGARQSDLGPAARLFVLESMAWPGRRLSMDPASGRLLLRPAAGEGAAPPLVFHFSALIPADSGAGAPAVAVGGCGGGGGRRPPALRLAAPAAEAYPKGARILGGKTKKYLVVPLGQLIDEHYTPYFDFSAAAQVAATA